MNMEALKGLGWSDYYWRSVQTVIPNLSCGVISGNRHVTKGADKCSGPCFVIVETKHHSFQMQRPDWKKWPKP